MRYLALACDYDGTLATHGRVDEPTIAALERVRASGRRLLMVSGRQLEDLRTVFDRLDLFNLAVLENGALLYRPASDQEQVLAQPPPTAFVDAIKERGVAPFSVGRVVVATWRPHDETLAEIIDDLGLAWEVILNKDAVMSLPSGVNKASGLRAGLEVLELSADTVVGVGDAENDLDFLGACGFAAAVDNALVPVVKARADLVTRGHHGAGVVELIDLLLNDALPERAPRASRERRRER